MALSSVRPPSALSSTDVVRAYEEEAERKRDVIRRANTAKDMPTPIAEAVRRLSTDEAFVMQPPKAEPTGSNPVGCDILSMTYPPIATAFVQ